MRRRAEQSARDKARAQRVREERAQAKVNCIFPIPCLDAAHRTQPQASAKPTVTAVPTPPTPPTETKRKREARPLPRLRCKCCPFCYLFGFSIERRQFLSEHTRFCCTWCNDLKASPCASLPTYDSRRSANNANTR